MAKGKFKCSKCDRTFAMAAHLARHVSTTHAAKGRKKTAKKKARRRKAKRRVGRPKGVKKKVRRAKAARRAARRPVTGGTAGLIRKMQAHQRRLSAQHAELGARIAGISSAIEAMGAPGAAPQPVRRRRRRRARRGVRPGSLKDLIVKVLRGKGGPMRAAEIARSVKKAGYKTKSKNLPNMVSNALGTMAGVRKVARGVYRA
ncbi:MAG: HTH domain-containing protein [Planctomycetota bacterium]|jgi:hypothetical protein